jgi:hypothetical protein
VEAETAFLRYGVEALYAAADPALLGGFEEVHALLHPYLRPEGFTNWPTLPKPLCPLKGAERRWFLIGILDVVKRAAVCLDRRTIQKIVYAPVLAAERKAYARSFLSGEFSAAKLAVWYETRGKGDRS